MALENKDLKNEEEIVTEPSLTGNEYLAGAEQAGELQAVTAEKVRAVLDNEEASGFHYEGTFALNDVPIYTR